MVTPTPHHGLRWLAGILAFTTAYATLRYNIFGSVAWSQWPLYILNKAISWTALTLLVLAYLSRPNQRAFLGVSGFFLALLHVLCTLSVPAPAYFPKLFDGPFLRWYAELSLLAGAAALCLLIAPALTSAPALRDALGLDRWKQAQRLGYFALAATALHLCGLGTPGWLTPSAWPGYLPPITLLAFLTALLPFVLRSTPKPR